jgi:pilus assembly protein CpaE
MGISDYLVRPLQQATLSNDIAATLLKKIGAADSRLIAMMGAKGGVGTTVLSQAMAWGIAEKLGQKTFLLDAAGGWSSLNVGMNFEPATTLAEAVRAATTKNQEGLNRMMFSPSEKLTVLSSGGDGMLDDHVPAETYEDLLDTIMATYPVVVVDLSGTSSALKRSVLARAHQIVLVAVPILPAIRSTRTLLQEIKQLRGSSDQAVDVVVNMTDIAKAEVSLKQIEEGLDRKVAAEVPFDPDLFIKAESEGRKISEEKTGGPIIDKLVLLARKVVSVAAGAGPVESTETKKGLGKLMSKKKK